MIIAGLVLILSLVMIATGSHLYDKSESEGKSHD